MDKKNMEVLLGSLNRTEVKTASALRDLLNESDAKSKPAKDGARSARERITMLFDEGTFVETGAYVTRRISEFDAEAADAFEGVICGWGSIGGKLVYAFSQDMARTKGSVSEAHAKKICEIYRLACENGAPVVGILDSAGAYLPEGVRALAGYGQIMRSISLASGVVPQIAVVPGIAEGASAVLAGMFDFVVMANGKLSVTPPFVLGREAGDEFAADNGLAALCEKDDVSAIASARTLIGYLPSNNAEGTAEVLSGDEVNRHADISAYAAKREAAVLISAAADDGRYIELYKAYAPEVSTGFISVGGTVCGVVANDYSVNGGVLTPNAARKAAKMVSFCDAFNIPVVTFVDSKGTSAALTSESAPYAAEIGKLANAYASARTPVITLIAGEAYGTVFAVMGSKALGADVALALDTAKVGCMNAASAVAFLWNDKIKGDVTREQLEKEWDATVGSPVEAARAGEIDDIIASEEIRQRIAAYVMMLQAKSKAAPVRRHINMPL